MAGVCLSCLCSLIRSKGAKCFRERDSQRRIENLHSGCGSEEKKSPRSLYGQPRNSGAHQYVTKSYMQSVRCDYHAIADLWAFADKVERSEILRVVFCSGHYE
jgi:hypothetical protein